MTRLATLVIACTACSGTARGLEAYRGDTQKLLDTRSAQLAQCYDAALKTDPKLSGTVTVEFVVAKGTGTIGNVAIVPAKTTAPKVLGDCVVDAIAGLALAPGDRDEGHATFVYEFAAKS